MRPVGRCSYACLTKARASRWREALVILPLLEGLRSRFLIILELIPASSETVFKQLPVRVAALEWLPDSAPLPSSRLLLWLRDYILKHHLMT